MEAVEGEGVKEAKLGAEVGGGEEEEERLQDGKDGQDQVIGEEVVGDLEEGVEGPE